MSKIALLFPGQGSQYIGMGKQLYNEFSVVRKVYEEAEDILGINYRKMCFDGDLGELTKTSNAQPAIMINSVALFKVYMNEIGVRPNFYAGHSLGEFSAMVCGGIIDFAQGVKLVRKRGSIMQKSNDISESTMVAVHDIESSKVESIIIELKREYGYDVYISSYNSLDQLVLSGSRYNIEAITKLLKENGARVTCLNVGAAFHSPFMKTCAEEFSVALKECTFGPISNQVISNVTARPYTNESEIVKNLILQMTKPVKWQETMSYIKEQGCDSVIEIGPMSVLTGLSKKNIKNVRAFSYDKEGERNQLLNELSFSKRIIKAITKCIAIAVCTQNSNCNEDEYRKGVVEPYNKIVELLNDLENGKYKPSIKNLNEALMMLHSIFNTKIVSMEERKCRYEEVISIAEIEQVPNELEMFFTKSYSNGEL